MDQAITNGDLEEIKRLYNFGEKCFDIMTDAARNGHLHIVKWAYEKNHATCSIDAMNQAAKNGHLEVVKWIHARIPEDAYVLRYPNNKEVKVPIRETEAYNSTGIDCAAMFGHLDVVEWLDEIGKECTTLGIDRAAGNGHLHVVKWLHARGKKCTTLGMNEAAQNGHLEMVKWLHSIGARCTRKAMDYACSRGHLHIVKWLHENIPPGMGGGCSDRAIHWAAGHGHLEVVKWLYENKPEDCTDQVTEAAINGHVEVVKWLLENRPEIKLKVWEVKFAIEYADRYGHKDVVEFLQEYHLKKVYYRAWMAMRGRKMLSNIKKIRNDRRYLCVSIRGRPPYGVDYQRDLEQACILY